MKFESLVKMLIFVFFYEIINFMCILSLEMIFILFYFFYGWFDVLIGIILICFVCIWFFYFVWIYDEKYIGFFNVRNWFKWIGISKMIYW